MPISRRRTMALGAAAAVMGPRAVLANRAQDAIAAFTEGAAPVAGTALILTLPKIAENGFTVPIAVAAPGATAIMVIAPENPHPEAVTFTFGPLAGAQEAATRIRLARTQEVTAIARMQDGTYQQVSRTVEVTIGGCGA